VRRKRVPPLDDKRRRVLAGSQRGVTEAILLANRCSPELLANLVGEGLATVAIDMVKAGTATIGKAPANYGRRNNGAERTTQIANRAGSPIDGRGGFYPVSGRPGHRPARRPWAISGLPHRNKLLLKNVGMRDMVRAGHRDHPSRVRMLGS